MSTAKFVISIDTELAWGSILFGDEILRKRQESFKNTRKTIEKIIGLFEKYNISATWAIVGHLMLENCTTEKGMKHPDIIRPNYSWIKKDWFYYDPCERDEQNSIWYGDDILDTITSCKVEQEIGLHSFSHIIFGFEGCSYECAESDIKKCIEVASLNNIKPISFVYPGNSIGYTEILKQYGFKIFRDKGIDKYKKIKSQKLKRIILILDKILAITPSTSKLEKDISGLFKIGGDFCFFRDKGWRNFLTYKSAVRKAKKGIDLAMEKGEVFHFWFHPFEIAATLPQSISDLEEILSYFNSKREQGLIENLTMSQLVDEYEVGI